MGVAGDCVHTTSKPMSPAGTPVLDLRPLDFGSFTLKILKIFNNRYAFVN